MNTALHRIDTNLTTLDVGRSSALALGEKWASFKILFHGFADLPSAVDQYTLSPEFTCVSIALEHCSVGYATAIFELKTLDLLGDHPARKMISRRKLGWSKYFIKRSQILDESTNIFDDNGTLAIIVSIKEEPTTMKQFIPKNPFSNTVQKKFLNCHCYRRVKEIKAISHGNIPCPQPNFANVCDYAS